MAALNSSSPTYQQELECITRPFVGFCHHSIRPILSMTEGKEIMAREPYADQPVAIAQIL